ncbi:hypothetical protein C8Q80DRAFT_908400 [Daedaleopsis nitida]|nr:hypothetical protein C8Q80DRAFT_908400 [Daedaleopsis nitida]
MGHNGGGVVEKVGSDVMEFKQGDRITFQGWYEADGKFHHGTFQQYAIALAVVATREISDDTSFKQAAMFSGMVTVAHSFYSHKPDTKSLKLPPTWETGDRGLSARRFIFVAGGSGQVGLFALQFAKLSGFTNIVTTASLHNTDLVKAYSATHVNRRKLPSEKVIEEVKVIAGGPVDLAFDAVSIPGTLKLSVAVLKQA